MKTTLLATVAVLGLAGGAVIADRAQVNLPQLAQGWHPSGDTSRSAQYAASGKPESQTDVRGIQYSASGLSQAETNQSSSA